MARSYAAAVSATPGGAKRLDTLRAFLSYWPFPREPKPGRAVDASVNHDVAAGSVIADREIELTTWSVAQLIASIRFIDLAGSLVRRPLILLSKKGVVEVDDIRRETVSGKEAAPRKIAEEELANQPSHLHVQGRFSRARVLDRHDVVTDRLPFVGESLANAPDGVACFVDRRQMPPVDGCSS